MHNYKELTDNIDLFCWLQKKAAGKLPVVKVETSFGDTEYHLGNEKGPLHREDGPAVERANGSVEYYKNGKHHNENGPAIVYNTGGKLYFQNGILHREDGPAIDFANGHKEYWLNGKRHNEEGPAIVDVDGTERYFTNGIEKMKIHKARVPLIINRPDPDNFKFSYAYFDVMVDWTDTLLYTIDDNSPIWVFNPETLTPIRQANFDETYMREVPVAKLKDIESGKI